MIDHLALNVSDLEACRRFYKHALAPFGYVELMSLPEGVGFGPAGDAIFWIAAREPYHTGVHVALAAKNRELVHAFYDAAMAAGGRDNGPPGLREKYHPHYYGAFVLDPCGNNIEAVCHTPEP